MPCRARPGARQAASAAPPGCKRGATGERRKKSTRSSLKKLCLDVIALNLMKNQLHVERPLDRVVAVRLCLDESERAVERLRPAHRRQRVEPHAPVAGGARLRDDCFSEPPAQTRAAEFRPDVEAFHFADAAVNLSERDAARRRLTFTRDDEPARGRGIFARQTVKLALKILEAQVNAYRSLVLAEQPPGLFDMSLTLGMINFHDLHRELTSTFARAEIKLRRPPAGRLVRYTVATSAASSAQRKATRSATMCSCAACAPSPSTPSPSSTATPHAAAKFPSEAPPTLASPNSKSNAEATRRALSKSAATASVRSIGGRLMPPPTWTRVRSSNGLKPRSAPSILLASSAVLKRTSTSARASAATTFACVPP